MAGVAEGGDAEEEGVVTGGNGPYRERAAGGRAKPEYNIAAMLILAIETVTRAGSLAIVGDGFGHARAGDPSRTHGERLPGEAIAWLAAHDLTLSDVTLFAVPAGPGSFTGLRIGIAAVQGFALAGARAVVAVPTLEALAFGFQHAHAPDGAIVGACLDGQRGEVFFAAFEANPARPSGEWRLLAGPDVAKPEEAAAAILSATAGSVVLVGTGATRYADVFQRSSPRASVSDWAGPLAGAVAEIAAAEPARAQPPHALRPIYVRRPDAVLARERHEAAAAASAAAAYTVARATPADDLGPVEVLQRTTFTNPWSVEAMRWELENTDVARLYLLRDRAGLVVGYCACWLVFDELQINSIAIDPRLRRRGLATRLLGDVIGEAITRGATAATLEVRESNQAARGLYERLGFTIEAVRRDYYQEPREDALIFWNRRLRQA
jgi:tRNA threonylcarbamoyladenosine biosynthesis protein TsaB